MPEGPGPEADLDRAYGPPSDVPGPDDPHGPPADTPAPDPRDGPATAAGSGDARGPAARRTETREEGHLRDVPPLPTSFPPWQEPPQDPLGPGPAAPPPPGRAPADPGVFGPPPAAGRHAKEGPGPRRAPDPSRDTEPHPDTRPDLPAGYRTDTRPDTPAPEAPAAPAPEAPAAPDPAPDPVPDPTAEWHAPPVPALPPHGPRPSVTHLGDGPPTYEPEPTALAAADPRDLTGLVADTVLDGAQYGSYTLRAASVRGDSARFRGEPRRDALLTARFGSGPGGLVLVAVASGARAAEGAHLAASDACHWIAGAVGRSHARLAEDIRAARRGDLKSGLHRLTDRSYGKLRARAAELGLEPGEYTADLRCLLLSADPDCRTRIYFGVGDGGLFRLRDGVWQDIEPAEPAPGALSGEAVVGFGSVPTGEDGSADEEGPDGDRLTMDLGITTPPSPYVDTVPPTSPFRFRASVARTADVLLLCSAGLAEPLRGEAALGRALADRWEGGQPPGLAAYLADVQLRVKGYADDRTAVTVWEA
ncbi:protein phosphatase 2C domain-containing protein [Streptomyces sp. NBC_00237]|uniref:protein phosphatase 2C domain-containing protein n=1 Tax=Streptomyces sp. NBC_00237 TaxID=2975687 RepID=UPI00225C33AC|nr:protein phosphatase 2C domain-containing protein [Streptomyces sp. NBC_00237]MCX5203377.1 protein phosphatase 2C domain-containing protein [Streptomyces sp. NBC_00237]